MNVLRFALCLALHLTLAVFWTSPSGAQTSAQTITDPSARMQLSGAFIGVNELVTALMTHCPGHFGDAPFGAEGALVKLRPFLSPDEYAELHNYVGSSEYSQQRTLIHEKVRRTLEETSAQSSDKAQACQALAQDILRSYATVKSNLAALR